MLLLNYILGTDETPLTMCKLTRKLILMYNFIH